MRVPAKRTLREFWEKHPDAESALRAWFCEAEHADWSNPAEIEARFPSASVVTRQHVVFNVCGNRYRLVAKIHFPTRIVLVVFVGTHAQYSRIKVEAL